MPNAITFFFCEWCALVELLNSLDSRSSELAIDAHFMFMVRTTTRKAGKPRFYCCTSFLHRFKIVCQGKINFNNLLTLSWLFYSLDMNSVFFLVTASILFYPVWSGKLSSGWWIWIGYLSVKDGAKCKKKATSVLSELVQ